MVPALVLARDLSNRVLGVIKVKVDEDSASLTNDPIAIQAHKEAFRKRSDVGHQVGFAEQISGIGVRKRLRFERGALSSPSLAQVLVPQCHVVSSPASESCRLQAFLARNVCSSYENLR